MDKRNAKKRNDLINRLIRVTILLLVLYLFSMIIHGPADEQGSPEPTAHINLIETTEKPENVSAGLSEFSLDSVPEPDGITPYVEVNGNVPFFSEEDKVRTDPFEFYSDLDGLGRCGVAYANVCVELQPTEKRGNISSVKPTGWVQNDYPDLIKDIQLYNRCHLIGFQLAGENANKLNLITGTRYLNVTGMLPFENAVDDYIEEYPDNHVLYRVTPVFVGDELVARGVLMEAYSVEDQGQLEFCVWCYNIQPGIWIDYATGQNGEIE